MAHTWAKRGTESDPRMKTAMVSDDAHDMYYRGHKIKEAWYRGHCIWRKERKVEPEEGYDVCFWDWDGTIVRHYSASSFLLKFQNYDDWPFQCHPNWTASRIFYAKNSSMAEIYRRSFSAHWDTTTVLTPNGYNWSFQDAYNQTLMIGMCDIGLMYSTPSTLQWVIAEKDGAVGYFNWNGSFDIDYGDGESKSVSQSGDRHATSSAQHVYKEAGFYLVKITGTHYSGQQNVQSGNFDPLYPSSTISLANRWGIDQTSLINLSGATSWGLQSDIHLLNATVHTFGLYVGTSGRLMGHALDTTWVGSLGFSNESSLGDLKQLGETLQGGSSFNHVTIPSTWTTLLNSFSFTHSVLNVTGANNDEFGEDMSPFANFGKYLKRIIYPSRWEGSIYIHDCRAMEQVTFTGRETNLGAYDGLGANLKKVVLPWGLFATAPDAIRFRKLGQMSEELKVYVPYAVWVYYFTLDSSQKFWTLGKSFAESVFSNIGEESWMVPYIVAGIPYSDYWNYLTPN